MTKPKKKLSTTETDPQTDILNNNELKEIIKNQNTIITNQNEIIEKLNASIENQTKLLNKMTENPNKNDLKTFAEITKKNIDSSIHTTITKTIKKTINQNNILKTRNKTIILYNIETTNEEHYNKRKEIEKSKIEEILNITETKFTILEHMRLGKYNENENRKRPIKIILDSELERNQILANANKLKNNNINNIRITREFTKEQLETRTKLIEEIIKNPSQNKQSVRFIDNNFKIIQTRNDQIK